MQTGSFSLSTSGPDLLFKALFDAQHLFGAVSLTVTIQQLGFLRMQHLGHLDIKRWQTAAYLRAHQLNVTKGKLVLLPLDSWYHAEDGEVFELNCR